MFRHGSKSEMSTIIEGFGIGDGFSSTERWNQKKKGAGNLGQSINHQQARGTEIMSHHSTYSQSKLVR
jgi:hypothetical protein